MSEIVKIFITATIVFVVSVAFSSLILYFGWNYVFHGVFGLPEMPTLWHAIVFASVLACLFPSQVKHSE